MDRLYNKFYERKGLINPQVTIAPVPIVEDVYIEQPNKKKKFSVSDIDEDEIIDYIINEKPSTNKTRDLLKKYVYG